MKPWLTLSLALLTTSCGGSFCAVYEPVYLHSEAAAELVRLDREAAELIHAQNEAHARCP